MRDRDEIKSRLSDATGMPKDVVLGIPIVTIAGREELYPDLDHLVE